MAGVCGIYAFDEIWNVSRFVYYQLIAIQSRGQESFGMSISDFKDVRSANGKGTIQESLESYEVNELLGCCGVGGVSTRDVNGYISDDIAIYFDGSVKITEEAVQKLRMDLGNMPEKEAVRSFLDGLSGAYSMVILTKEKMIATRDKLGVKPLVIGGVGFDLAVVASETSALDVIGAELSRDIEPGEIVVIDRHYIEEIKAEKRPPCANCIFEYVYMARIDSKINGIYIHEIRNRIGKLLAKQNPVEADVVIGVPETAIPFAMAYSNESKIPLDIGFMRTGKVTRTAIKPTQMERMIGVQLKLNPVRTAVRGKRVVLIDDSVVRGTTMRNIVNLLRKRGAKEVHVRICSPKLISPCPFGTEVPTKDELIAVDNTEYEIASIIDADSFAYISVDDLVNVLGGDGYCSGCMTGNYPEVD
ncbi:MAG: amidophosphoribosyltransferase [Candidatus Methanofastidiosa archaeon]|nr:amidophosphoribosyltransferase [Candidatus Methanofastidiosa archaeon]